MSADTNIGFSESLNAALKAVATTAQAVAVRDDIVAEILNLRADVTGQIVVLRGDLVGQIEIIRHRPAEEQKGRTGIPTARQLIGAIIAGYAVLAIIGAVAIFVLQ